MPKLSEPVAAALLDILKAGMSAVIDKINAEYAALDANGAVGQASVEVPLPYIKSFYFGEREPGPSAPDAPCVIVDVAGAAIDPERFDNTWAQYDHQVTVTTIVESDDVDVITRQNLRYARAVWEVLYGNQTDKDGSQTQAVSVRPLRGGASQVTRDQDNPTLYRAWTWLLEVHRYDDLT